MPLNFGWVYLHANVTRGGIHRSDVLYWKVDRKKAVKQTHLFWCSFLYTHQKTGYVAFFPQGRHFFETPSSSRGGGLFLVTLFGGSPTQQRRLLCLYMQKTLWLAMNINTSGFVQLAGGNTLVWSLWVEQKDCCHVTTWTHGFKRGRNITRSKRPIYSIYATQRLPFSAALYQNNIPSRQMI